LAAQKKEAQARSAGAEGEVRTPAFTDDAVDQTMQLLEAAPGYKITDGGPHPRGAQAAADGAGCWSTPSSKAVALAAVGRKLDKLIKTSSARVYGSAEAAAGRLLDIVRGLVERVVVTPAADSGFEVELTGAIAAIIALAQDGADDDPALLVCSEVGPTAGSPRPSRHLAPRWG
jgi:hypothetical protein